MSTQLINNMKFLCVAIFLISVCSPSNLEQVSNNEPFVIEAEFLSRVQSVIHKTKDGESAYHTPLVCSQCHEIVKIVITLRKSGANRETLRSHLADLCQYILNYTESVCQVFSEIETDVIAFIIDNKSLQPEQVCGIYLQHKGCLNPYAKNWTIDIPNTNINFSPSEVNNEVLNKAPDVTSKPIRIVQITDVHYDPLYLAGSNAKCNLPLCCEGRNGIPKTFKEAAGLYGDYNVCDMPQKSILNLFEEIKKSVHDIDYIYFTGDIIAHKNWETSRESNLETIKSFYNFLHQYFDNTSTAIYPILGNHEAHPCNLYAPLNASIPEKIGTKWLFDAVADYWSKWLPKDALETIKLGGYYTVLVRPGFRIIALNSNVCFTENLWLFYEDEDPYDQLKWLVKILLEAEKNYEKVHILSHVPPGEAMCLRRWQYNFNRIVQRFAKTISGHFNGHTHVDEFRIFKNETNTEEVINVAFNGGSFTTFTGLNPDYRIYDVDSENYMVTNFHQYTFNLSLANNQNVGPKWFKLYSFKEAYGLKDLKYSSFNSLNNLLRTKEDLAKQYVKYHVRESEFAFENGCNSTCVQSQICHISAIDADESIACGSFSIYL